MGRKRDWKTRGKQIAPWVITAGAIAMILQRFSVHEIAERVREGNAVAMIPVGVLFAVLQILGASTWDWLLLRKVIPRLRWRDLAKVKAGVTTLQSVAYLATQGAYAAWIARGAKIGVRNALGVLTLFACCDLAAGCWVITIAASAVRADVPMLLKIGAPIGAIVMPAVMLAVPRRPFDAQQESSILRVAASVPRSALVACIVGRMAQASMVSITTWMAARAFGMAMPFGVMLAYVPILFAVGSLPVNVGGFGAVQGAWLVLSPWAAGAQILAFHFLWNLMQMAGQVLRGAPFVRGVIEGVVARNPEVEMSRGAPQTRGTTDDSASIDP